MSGCGRELNAHFESSAHWNTMPQIHSIIFHSVTVYWHLTLSWPVLIPSAERLAKKTKKKTKQKKNNKKKTKKTTTKKKKQKKKNKKKQKQNKTKKKKKKQKKKTKKKQLVLFLKSLVWIGQEIEPATFRSQSGILDWYSYLQQLICPNSEMEESISETQVWKG